MSARIVDEVETRYRLDAVGRVDAVAVGGVVAEQFGYDASDNIRTAVVAGSSGGAGRWEYRGTLLVDDGRSRYSYDRAGRLVRTVSRRLSRRAEVWHYRWDAYDRLRSVTTPDGQTWTYGYDSASRRTRKANGSTGESVVFAWLGDQLVEQTAAAEVGAVTTTWCYPPGAVTPLAQVHTAVGSGMDVPLRLGGSSAAAASCGGRVRRWSQPEVDRAFYALVTDHLGTPTHLVDPDAATVVGRASGGLWGQTSWTGDASTPLRFPAQYFDAETGWHYNRHRYYQPATGRYATADPRGLAPAPNPYGYPRNPTVETDPWGLMPCPIERDSAPTSGFINPNHVRFTQDSIKAYFRDGFSVRELVDMLKSRRIHPEQIRSIRLVEFDGNIYTLDNRRRWAFQQANIPEIPYELVRRADVSREWARKFVTMTDGPTVKVRDTNNG